jgi:hypothetical protein
MNIDEILVKIRERGLSLGAPLSEAEVSGFEARHGITLPADFRLFITKVGNGGGGPPHYGLAKLGEVADDMSQDQKEVWGNLPHVAKPFPFTTHWVWETGDESEEGSEEQVEWGSIYLGNDGCGMYWYLIVTGEKRGHVWQFADVGILPTVPERTFFQWYTDWLDGCENWWNEA